MDITSFRKHAVPSVNNDIPPKEEETENLCGPTKYQQ